MSRSPWVVLKFGGTSVSTPERWETIAKVVRSHLSEGRRPLLVCSALSQVSNRLEALLGEAAAGAETSPMLDALWHTHAHLAGAMGVDAEALIGARFAELSRLIRGVSLTREVTPRLRAQVMAFGELMSTALGAAWLNRQGVETSWQDARTLLAAEPVPAATGTAASQHLSATCSHGFEAEVEARLRDLDAGVVLTQGFIARAPDGGTALLGRGGSDTSAAYLAARLGAERLEIWTDVPGLFTANPREVDGARLLRRLTYVEASEIATRGAKVLHPRCLAPVRDADIPLHLRCTDAPEAEGTVISSEAVAGAPRVKAVSSRKGILLVSMELEGDWQRVGVIADLATCFKRHGLSLDALASSQTHVTVALDPAANRLESDVLDPLLAELAEHARPRLIGPTASVSVIGSSMRAILHELGPILERLEDEEVHLLAHAANDLSLTFIVDEGAADRVVQGLHAELFPPSLDDPAFAPAPGTAPEA